MKSKLNKIRIATADDHKVVRDTICFCVEVHAKNRMKVVINVDNGKDLLKQLSTKKTDVLFLDLQMPDVKGEETCRYIKKRFPDLKIHHIYFSPRMG